jgi:hypothetical protein
LGDWSRDSGGYVSIVPLDRWGAGVTEQGDIALSFGGRASFGFGDDEHRGKFLCSKSDAMNIAKIIVRAVALADAQATAPGGAAQNEAAD